MSSRLQVSLVHPTRWPYHTPYPVYAIARSSSGREIIPNTIRTIAVNYVCKYFPFGDRVTRAAYFRHRLPFTEVRPPRPTLHCSRAVPSSQKGLSECRSLGPRPGQASKHSLSRPYTGTIRRADLRRDCSYGKVKRGLVVLAGGRSSGL